MAQLCEDDTPMVRRAAAANFSKFVAVVEPEVVEEQLFPLFGALAVDDQVRCCRARPAQGAPTRLLLRHPRTRCACWQSTIVWRWPACFHARPVAQKYVRASHATLLRLPLRSGRPAPLQVLPVVQELATDTSWRVRWSVRERAGHRRGSLASLSARSCRPASSPGRRPLLQRLRGTGPRHCIGRHGYRL